MRLAEKLDWKGLIFFYRCETVLSLSLELTASMYQKSILADTFRMIDRFRSGNCAFYNFRSDVSVYILPGKPSAEKKAFQVVPRTHR
jgi:hypothetical protein